MKKVFLLFSLVFLSMTRFVSASEINNDLELGIKRCLYETQKYYDFEEVFLKFAGDMITRDMDYQYNVNDIISHLKKIKEYKQHIENIAIGTETIDSVLFTFLNNRLLDIKCRDEERKYASYSINNQERLENKVSAAVTFFQFSNHIITQLYQLTNPCDLSVRTRKYIRLSPTLWPLLNEKSEGFGHPDSAIEDLNYFNIYVDPSERVSITYRNWCNQTRVHQTTPYERSLYDERWKQYGKIAELPYPDWLNPYKIAEINDDTIDSQVEETDLIINDTETPLFINDHIDSVSDEITQLIQDDEESIVVHPTPENLAKTQNRNKITSKKKKIQERKRERSENIRKIIENKKNTPQSVEAIVPPRGMRIFHSDSLSNFTFETQTSIDDLRGKHLNTLESIFDYQQYTNVTYKKFSSLWKAINGKNSVRESTGSSHKALLDKNGRTVTGIFAHNGGMRYTKSTIPYIRHALQLIGFGIDK